jgi:hypothetical protein
MADITTAVHLVLEDSKQLGADNKTSNDAEKK